ncbi:MAG TPA: insulinase family protein [Gemmatimonadaceae bacterium]|jgi:zinc protease|nr:insulinase family protein [Gemmatimonadaceae bacterium]
MMKAMNASIMCLTALVPLMCAAQGPTISYEVNGLQVIQQPSAGSQIVTVSLYLLGGTRQLAPATAGIERVALEAAAGGTNRYPGVRSNIALARTGSRLRVIAGVDWTTFGFVGLVDQVDSTWAVFADRVVAPRLDSASVAVARARLRLEAHRRRQDPNTFIQAIADSVVFAGHPYAIDPNGTTASMDAITAADVHRYVAEQFVTSRMLLVVVGPVPPERVQQAVAATLGTLPRGTYRWTPPPPLPAHDRPTLSVVTRPLGTDYLFGYFNGPPVTSSDYAAFQVATDMLNGRLRFATAHENNVVRPDPALSYTVSATFYGRAIAMGGLYSMTDAPSLVLTSVRTEIWKVQWGWYQLYALTDYLDHFTSIYYLSNATGAGRADQLARAAIYLGDYRKVDAEFEALRHVQMGQIQAATGYYTRHIQFVYVGDPEDIDPSLMDAF